MNFQCQKTAEEEKKIDTYPKQSLSLEALYKHYFPNKTYHGMFFFYNEIKISPAPYH